jgi:hypothetical protein
VSRLVHVRGEREEEAKRGERERREKEWKLTIKKAAR